MEYKVEDLSPCKRKVAITVDPKEVEASIMATIAIYRTNTQVDGFRKGKVPASVLEKRFSQQIYEEARQDLVNVHINEVMQNLKVTPVSGIDFDGPTSVTRGEAYNYSITFEVLPEFDIPPYEGLETEQEKAVVKDDEIEEVTNRIRRDKSKLIPINGDGPAVDGQVASIDFAAYENGEPVEGIAADNFEMVLGEKQALPAFEELVKTIKIGEEKEGEVSFPADFIAPDIAGKTLTMKVKVHAINNRLLPELSDELAKEAGFESLEKMREAISESYLSSRRNLYKGAAQKRLLDKLLKMVDFALPEAMVENHVRSLLADMQTRLERQGKSLAGTGKTEEQLREQVKPEAESITRAEVLLLAIAKKEGIEVTEHEVTMYLYQMCQRSGEDFKSVREAYERSGMMFTLRDRMMADKAMEAIYTKSVIKEVDAVEEPAKA